MARIDWKKKYDAMSEVSQVLSKRVGKLTSENWELRRSVPAIKGQLTRERKKNAEARELVELLEWSRNRVKISNDPAGRYQISVYSDDGFYQESVFNRCLLLALRAAKNTAEDK